jgi:hypothetical protein
MALTPRLSIAGANAAANAACALANGGFLDIYDGAQPANADTAVGAQVKLAHLPLSATAFGAAAAGVATANVIAAATALATSTATWFRVYKSDGVSAVFDGSVGTAGANLNLSTVAVVSGGTVTVTSLTYTQAQV